MTAYLKGNSRFSSKLSKLWRLRSAFFNNKKINFAQNEFKSIVGFLGGVYMIKTSRLQSEQPGNLFRWTILISIYMRSFLSVYKGMKISLGIALSLLQFNSSYGHCHSQCSVPSWLISGKIYFHIYIYIYIYMYIYTL